ncbi:MAG: cobalamin-binding protein [Nitrospirae bacterium]|nr:cobalamin-binding protein [Nitrospirota bacterium]
MGFSMVNKYIIVLLSLITLLMSSSVANAASFTDDLGRKVELPKNPERIISLAPSITEILFFLGLGDKVTAVTDYCDFPEEARHKTKIGWIISPDIEKIISLKPDIVFATAEGNRSDIVDTLERINIRVYVLDPHKVEDVLHEIVSIGEITGRVKTAKKKVDELSTRIKTIKKKVNIKHKENERFPIKNLGNDKIRVLYLVSTDPIVSAGPGSFIHDIIEYAGGENILAQSPVRYPRVEMEEIMLRDPEVIIVSDDSPDIRNSWKMRWGSISAVKNNRIYTIDPDIISRPGPRIVEGIEEFYRDIYMKSPSP